MKPLVIHPGSALAGAAVLGLVFFGVSATQESSRQSVSQTTFTPIFPTATPIEVEITNLSDIVLDGPVRIEGQPHPRDYIALQLSWNSAKPAWSESTGPGDDVPWLAVPTGCLFVVTSLDTGSVRVLDAPSGSGLGQILASQANSPNGVTVRSGMTIEPQPNGVAYITGYFIDA